MTEGLRNVLGHSRSGSANVGSFIGMDEAGYGPNLGPLLIAVTRWTTPVEPHLCQFYELLSAAVDPISTSNGQKLHLADSKVVNRGKHGFRSLETSALALLQCVGITSCSLATLQESVLTREESAASPRAPWYDEHVSLPFAANPEEIRRLSDQLLRCMERAGIHLTSIQADLVSEQRFNDHCDAPGSNKGVTLSQLAFRLLRSIWSPDETVSTLMIGDKHGGRNRYDDLLAEVLDGSMIFRLQESQKISQYRVGNSVLQFQVGGECHLPVACASIIAKYLREISMIQFNSFWSRHCPDVKRTLGYPNDARRFRQQVDEVRKQLGIADALFWRNR